MSEDPSWHAARAENCKAQKSQSWVAASFPQVLQKLALLRFPSWGEYFSAAGPVLPEQQLEQASTVIEANSERGSRRRGRSHVILFHYLVAHLKKVSLNVSYATYPRINSSVAVWSESQIANCCSTII